MYAFPAFTAFSLAALFGVIGVMQVAGPRFLHDAYRAWDYPQGLRLVTGLLDIAAAVMLAVPGVRGWGIALAAILAFGSVVTLLNHRQNVYAAAVIVMMAALLPATLAVPRANQVRFMPAGPQLLATTR